MKTYGKITVCFIFFCFEFAEFCLSLKLSDSCTRKDNEHKILVYVCYTLVISQTHIVFYSLVQSPLFRLKKRDI